MKIELCRAHTPHTASHTASGNTYKWVALVGVDDRCGRQKKREQFVSLLAVIEHLEEKFSLLLKVNATLMPKSGALVIFMAIDR